MLHTHLFGSDDPAAPIVLALHGLTGHGRRWSRLADDLPGVRVLAPDLLGHGHSPWEPPWGVADHAAAVAATLETHVAPQRRPVVVVAHSFGSVIALSLAYERPDLVRGLVLLDPAQGLAPAQARAYAEATLAHWGHPDAASAIAAKRAEGWYDVAADILDDEIEHHLMPAEHGVVWRVSPAATASAWSDMARPFRLPPATVPTHVVVASRVDPPFVRPEFLAACAAERPTTVTVHRVDTEHMVPFLAPALAARLVRDLVDR